MDLDLGLELWLCPEPPRPGTDSHRCPSSMLTFLRTSFSHLGLHNIKGFRARGSLGRCSPSKVAYSLVTQLEDLLLVKASSRGLGREEQCLDMGLYLRRWDPTLDPETPSSRPSTMVKVIPQPQDRCVQLGMEAPGCPPRL